MGKHIVIVNKAFDQHFNLAAGLFAAEETGFHHPGIVENQQITRLQQIGKIRKMTIQ